MDEIIPYIKSLDNDVLAILMTALFGIFAWLVKTFIIDPVEKSRETFEANLDNRIRINTEVKNVLSFLLLVDDKQKTRDQLQVILTRDGATAYLDRKILADVIKIALDENMPDQEITRVIKSINGELDSSINKIAEENRFYRVYYSSRPLRRMSAMLMLVLMYTLMTIIILTIATGLIYLLMTSRVIWKVTAMILLLVFIFGLRKYLS